MDKSGNNNGIEKEEKPLSVFLKGIIIGVVILVLGAVAVIAVVVVPVALSLRGWE